MSMIGLLDANNFFVSCERLFRPDLLGKPVAVLSGNDGCIVARSNEVKAMGVPMGIPLFQAKKLVDMSQVTLFSSNFTLYRDVSRRVMEVLVKEIGPVEQYSIDESFFNISKDIRIDELAALRERVMVNTGIPVSIGVSSTKTLAKVASELGKKGNGVELLTTKQWSLLAATYSAGEVWNLGRATATKLKQSGIRTAADVMAAERSWIGHNFGVGGCRVYDELNGKVVHQVNVNSDSVRKSLTSTRSFAKVTTSLADVESAVAYHLLQVAAKLRAQNLLASRLYVLARASRHSDFAFRTGGGEVVLERPSNETAYLLKQCLAVVRKMYDKEIPYKKAGVTASGLVPPGVVQTELFTTSATCPTTTSQTLDGITDSLNQRFGAGMVRPAVVAATGSRTSAALRSKSYTTAWKDIPTVTAK